MRYSLYISRFCFYCQRVLRALGDTHPDIVIRDVGDQQTRRELMQGGGKSQVPCLLIEENGQRRWMYESADIIRYLQTQNLI